MSIRILLADDHPKVRAQIRTRLSREADLDIVAEAGTSAQAVECALVYQPRVVLIDPMMHDGSGLEAVRHIAERLPATAVVVLTAFADTALQIDLRKLGVRQILAKDIESERLVRALREAAGAGQATK